MSAVIDEGECFECGKEVDMTQAPADPMGRPLCKDCFNVNVRMGKSEDAEDLI